MNLAAGDRVRVQYQFNKFFEGTVIYTDTSSFMKWAYVRPDESRFISTFGSSRDMALGYKGYIFDDSILGQVEKL